MKSNNFTRRTDGFLSKFFFIFLTFLTALMIIPNISYASTNWVGWGNAGTIYGTTLSGLSNTMFSSNYPQGNLDFFTNKTITTTNYVQPIIFDLDNSGNNEIYTFQTNSITQFDNNGNYVNSITFNGTICGLPIVALNSSTKKIVVLTKYASTKYNIYMLQNDYGSISNSLDNEDFISFDTDVDFTCGALLGGINQFNNLTLQGEVYAIFEDNDVFKYDIRTNTGIVYHTTDTTPAINYDTIKYPFRGGQVAVPKSPNKKLLLAWASKTSDTLKLNIFDTNDNTFDHYSFTGSSLLYNVTVGGGVIGSPSGSGVFVIIQNSPSSNNNRIWIYDYSGNLKTSKSISGLNGNQLYCIADIDFDGLNEFCYSNNDDFECLDGAMNLKYDLNLSSNVVTQEFIACGEYSNDGDSFQEIITDDGIFQKNATGGLSKISDLNQDGKFGMYIPVSIQAKQEFTKDVLFVDENELVYYVASGTPSVCGDLICSSGETVYNCFFDCGNTTETTINETVGSLGYNQICYSDSDCYGDLVCKNNLCTGLSGGNLCTEDFECMSGSCNSYGYCEDVTFVEGTKGFFFQVGIRSNFDKILMSMIIVFLFTMAGGTLGNVGGTIGAVIGAVMGFVLSLFAMVFAFGWLGIWTIFMLIFIVIVILVTSIMLFGGGSGGF